MQSVTIAERDGGLCVSTVNIVKARACKIDERNLLFKVSPLLIVCQLCAAVPVERFPFFFSSSTLSLFHDRIGNSYSARMEDHKYQFFECSLTYRTQCVYSISNICGEGYITTRK